MTFTLDQLAARSMYRRAVEAAIWGVPAVNFDAMYQALVRDAGGAANQIVYWSRLLDSRNQTLTPNPDAIYLMPFYDTTDGPMVLEVPPAQGGSITGSIDDAWQCAIGDVGPAGSDAFDGSSTYRLTVPPNVPVTLYWSVTAYDRRTHTLIAGVPWASRSSNTPELHSDEDGSVTLFFGPEPPDGHRGNWIPTRRDRPFELLCRFYGPQPAFFDKSWRLPDVERTP